MAPKQVIVHPEDPVMMIDGNGCGLLRVDPQTIIDATLAGGLASVLVPGSVQRQGLAAAFLSSSSSWICAPKMNTYLKES